VSRLFSQFQKRELIRVHGRTVKLLDLGALMQVAGQRC
jgi:hypothetical protein